MKIFSVHISSLISHIATAMLHLLVKIWPRKSDSNLTQLILSYYSRVYAEALYGKVYHFRDQNGLECDAVVHLRDGRYGLVEVKLGGDVLIEEGAQTLLKLSGKIDTGRMKKPSFMMVLVGVGIYAYRREDGVYVVPIECLKD